MTNKEATEISLKSIVGDIFKLCNEVNEKTKAIEKMLFGNTLSDKNCETNANEPENMRTSLIAVLKTTENTVIRLDNIANEITGEN